MMSYEFTHRISNIGVKPERITDGTRVRHYGTKQWAVILRSIPQSDGTFEYEIKREDGLTYWWASYHIDRMENV